MGRKNCGCDCGSDNHDIIDSDSRECGSEGRRGLFPTDIRRLLILLADNDDDQRSRACIVLDACANHCFIEDAKVIAVMDNTVVLRDCDKFRFVCIGCICEVIVECDVILEDIFQERTIGRRR